MADKYSIQSLVTGSRAHCGLTWGGGRCAWCGCWPPTGRRTCSPWSWAGRRSSWACCPSSGKTPWTETSLSSPTCSRSCSLYHGDSWNGIYFNKMEYWRILNIEQIEWPRWHLTLMGVELVVKYQYVTTSCQCQVVVWCIECSIMWGGSIGLR